LARRAVRRLVHREQVPGIVVGVVPCLQAGALALLGHVAVSVVSVRPCPVVEQLIPGACAVAGHVPVAVGVIGVRPHAIVGQLVGRVIGIGVGGTVQILSRHPVQTRTVGVGHLLKCRAAAVLVHRVGEVSAGTPGVIVLADLRAAADVTVFL